MLVNDQYMTSKSRTTVAKLKLYVIYSLLGYLSGYGWIV